MLAFDLWLLGGLFILGICHFGLFLLRSKDYAPLFFALFCLAMGLFLLLSGGIINFIIPSAGIMFRKLAPLGAVAALPLLTMYLNSLFPEDFSRLFNNIISASAVLFCFIYLTLPTVPAFAAYLLVVSCGAVYAVKATTSACIRKREGAALALAGLLCLFGAQINDILNSSKIIATGEYVSFGLFLFILSRTFDISQRLTNALPDNSPGKEAPRPGESGSSSSAGSSSVVSSGTVANYANFSAIARGSSPQAHAGTAVASASVTINASEFTILVVDDEPINRVVVENNLRTAGFNVVGVGNGPGALEIVRTNIPDLMLLDLMMPRMSGFEVLAEVRKNHTAVVLPVVMLTVRNQVQDLVQCLSLGANDYVTKPFSRDELIARITFHLNLKKITHELDELKNDLERKVVERTRELQDERGKSEKLLTEILPEMAGAGNSLAAARIVARSLLELEGRRADCDAALYLPAKADDFLHCYNFSLETTGDNSVPSIVPQEKTRELKNISSPTILPNGALVLPVRSDGEFLAVLEIARFTAPSETIDNSARDIMNSMIHALALKLENLEMEEHRRLANIGSMAANIVHDLKNPISIILGCAEMANEPDIGSEHRSGYLSMIREEAQRLSEMAQEVLDFSRGEFNLNIEETNSREFLNANMKLVKPLFHEKGIELGQSIEYDGPIRMDVARMRRLVLNLATNALDAMSAAQTQSARFDVGLYRDGNQAVFTFSDNGPGIPEQIRARLFEPFVTHGKKHGTGLGMAIVKGTVRAHGGSIAFSTATGAGARFIVHLPLK